MCVWGSSDLVVHTAETLRNKRIQNGFPEWYEQEDRHSSNTVMASLSHHIGPGAVLGSMKWSIIVTERE